MRQDKILSRGTNGTKVLGTLAKRRLTKAELRKNFSTGLNEVFNTIPRMTQRELASMLGVTKSTVNAWLSLTGTQMPGNVWMLYDVASKLDKLVDWDVSVHWLLGLDDTESKGVPYLDSPYPAARMGTDIFNNARDALIDSADHSVWAMVSTGDTLGLSNTKNTLQSITKEGRIGLRLLIGDPDDETTMARVAARRNPPFERSNDPKDAKGAAERTIELVQKAATEGAGLANGTVEIRTTQYVPSTFTFIADATDDGQPSTKQGRALALLYNFKQDFPHAPVIEGREGDHTEMFEFFRREFLNLWHSDFSTPKFP